jgi:hypothetical protein
MGLLYQLEQTCIRLRHSAVLKRCSPLWDALRPCYNALMKRASQSAGLMRNFNGTDNVRILAEFRNLHETYEPEVWHVVMNHVRAGSRVIDVGAHMGLYAMAFGHRVGPEGRVLAVEPDPANLVSLELHDGYGFDALARDVGSAGLIVEPLGVAQAIAHRTQPLPSS